jgi:formate dehydrogenase subunit gamma
LSKHASWNSDRANTIIEQFKTVRGGLLPALHALQHDFGYVDDSAIPQLATAFNQSNADIYGVITFYHDFKRSRPGHHTIKVCRGEACQAMGAEELIADIEHRLKVEVGGKTADGEFSLEHVFCLGNCALSPSVQMDETLHGRVTIERIESLCREARL